MPFLRHAGDALDQRAGERAGEDRVGERRRERTVAGQFVGEAEDVVMERVQAALVVLGQELRFVGGHVHLHRALGLAGFATQAEVERFVDGLALEAFVRAAHPASISHSRRARPRVECCSSPVAR